ncbi:hypothetical protein [Planctomicrobium sp. SH527]|uniref:hypothetical protein n=1 Tax=Planctomicrobium sp. SH527 TaxID=3448123 RepID=UPI003F5C9747
MKRLLRIDWDVIAGITAAVIAIVLHLLHIVDVEVLFTIILVLLALLLFRDLRRESHDEHLGEAVNQIKGGVKSIEFSLAPPAAVLIGPRYLRSESRRFVETARGEMVWFNVCFLMFRSQEVFDLLLKPAIENPLVRSIQFISDESERDLWTLNMLSKIKECDGSGKVLEPRWRTLPQTVSFILAETEQKGQTEALLSFWGEPFMARTIDKQVPRYVFWVHGHSDLVAQLVDLERKHRI